MTATEHKQKNTPPKHTTATRPNSTPASSADDETHHPPAPHFDVQEQPASTNTEIESAKSGNNDAFETDSRPE